MISCRQLSLRILPSCRQLSLVRVRHKTHFLLFSNWRHVFTPRARKRHLVTTGIGAVGVAR